MIFALDWAIEIIYFGNGKNMVDIDFQVAYN